jgi:hypothetical protein
MRRLPGLHIEAETFIYFVRLMVYLTHLECYPEISRYQPPNITGAFEKKENEQNEHTHTHTHIFGFNGIIRDILCIYFNFDKHEFWSEFLADYLTFSTLAIRNCGQLFA